jgi:hypothetical protein
MQSRRKLLQAAAVLVGGGTTLSFGRAYAWQTLEVDPESPLGQAYNARCGGDSQHAAVQAGLRAALMKDPSAKSLSAPCPICGCPVSVSR